MAERVEDGMKGTGIMVVDRKETEKEKENGVTDDKVGTKEKGKVEVGTTRARGCIR